MELHRLKGPEILKSFKTGFQCKVCAYLPSLVMTTSMLFPGFRRQVPNFPQSGDGHLLGNLHGTGTSESWQSRM